MFPAENPMDVNMLITLCILAVAVVFLVGDLLRADLVAVLIILSLMLSGVLELPDALSGFSNNAVIIIACMFIVGKAIINTGIAQRVGDAIIRYGGSNERRLLLFIMLAAGSVGAFMSSTATAAIFIPITLSVAEKAGLNHRRLLMPLAVAAMISGMMTLVATTANIVVNGTLLDHGVASLPFFSFTPFGVLILTLAYLFMAFAGQNMLAGKGSKVERKKDPFIDDLLQYHNIAKFEYQLRVGTDSPLVGKSVASMQLGAEHHVILLALQTSENRRRREILAARPEMIFHAGDLLLLIGSPESVNAFAGNFSLSIVTVSANQRRAFFQVVGVAELMLNPESQLLGKTLRQALFQSISHSMVLGIRRKGETLTDDIADTPMRFGDILLICGAWSDIVHLKQNRQDYILLTIPEEYKALIPAREKENTALAILAAMVLLMAFNLLAPVTAILAATCALVLTRCVPLGSIYEVIDWQTIVLIAGILPLALALQKTGVIPLVSAAFLRTFAGADPLLVLAGLFLITALLGLAMSNTAVAVLVAPMAVTVGDSFGISAQACAMVVAIACSSAFVSPLGSPVNMIVREPGKYAFKDYAKVGIPLLV
ncbi:SLC13 family permease, partial [Desulfovibrio sp. OttesenSCG-928-A18]|nr:SLC13 family permease [Desulfovibrio sp. OttesenSCG-928-A18]